VVTLTFGLESGPHERRIKRDAVNPDDTDPQPRGAPRALAAADCLDSANESGEYKGFSKNGLKSYGCFVMSNIETKRKIAVMHIPKAAGHSITGALVRALAPKRQSGGYDLSLFGEFGKFDSFDDSIKDIIYNESNPLPLDSDLIIGHIARSSLSIAYPSHSIVTIIREPKSRLLSNWLFWRSNSDEQLIPWGEWGGYVKIARQPFLNFLTDPRIASHTDNLFLRMLLWPHPKILGGSFLPPETDAELLAAARNALGSFDFVGTIEDPALHTRLGQFLGIEIKMSRANETIIIDPDIKPILDEELNDSTLSAIYDRSRLDAVLWDDVVGNTLNGASSKIVTERIFLNTLLRYIAKGVVSSSSLSQR